MKKSLLMSVILVLFAAHAWAFTWESSDNQAFKGARLLAQSAVPASAGGSLSEVTLVTVPVPPMGKNDALRVTFSFAYTNSANAKKLRLKLDGVSFVDTWPTTSTNYSAARLIRNRGAQNSQISETTTASTSTTASVVSAIDTSVSKNLTFTGQTSLETGFTPTNTNMSGTGSVVTVVKSAHGLNTGESVKCSGASTAGYNADPVTVTVIDANTFTYPGTGTGTPTTAPLIQRYSVITLESYTVELISAF